MSRKRYSFISTITTVIALTKAFTVRYMRDKVALFFTFLFPLIFLLIFGTIFGGDGAPRFTVVTIDRANTTFSNQFIEGLEESDIFTILDTESFDKAKEQMGRGEISAIIELPEGFGEPQNSIPSGNVITYVDEGDEQTNAALFAVLESIIDDVNQQFMQFTPPLELEVESIQTANISRFDYVIAGLIGFAILSLGIFSMSEGFTVDKKNGSLRRMQVAPVRRWQIIIATALNRVFVGLIAVALLFVVALLFFDFTMRGDYISFILFTIIGTLCLFGFGMAIAGWARDANQAAPLANLISFPMIFLSGVFFPVFIMPELLQTITTFIPLTPVIEGLRLIMTEGRTIFDLGPQLLIIGAWTAIIYIITFKTFRWE